jgi:hypothetical protein
MIVMRILLSARWPAPVLLALALLLGLARPGDGQIAVPSDDARGPSRRAPTLVISIEGQAQEVPQVFVPLVVRPPDVGIQFGTGVDTQNNLVNPGTVFAYGIARLYYRYTVTGAPGQPYRTEWFADGVRQRRLDDSGTIPATDVSAVFTNFFCSPTLGSCDQPVPRGVYRVRFYIDDVFYREATAVVQ